MANHLESTIHSLVSGAASRIAAAVRADIAAQIAAVMGGRAAAAPAPTRGRPKGRKAAAAKPGRPGRPKKAAKFHRRTSASIARDNDRLLAYIKSHPAQRSEQIQKGCGLAKPAVAAGLVALRDAGRIKMKGVKRAATYSAA
jgi:hypothetical protein